MKANEAKRVYEIYNRSTDIDLLVTEDLGAALHVCGDIVDNDDDILHDVYVYNNITVDDYYNTGVMGRTADHYDIKDFIAKFSIFEREVTMCENDLVNKEVYHNMAPEEQLEVLRYIPDVVLVDDLARRLREYRSATDAAAEALDLMKIFV